jgi:hypothetical protein
MSSHSRVGIVLAGLLLCLGVMAPGAGAAKPTLEKVAIDEEFVDEELSEYCGFEIMAHVVGRVTARTFGEGGRIRAVNSVNVKVTLSAHDNEFALHDVGADVTKVLPDGTIVLALIGQLPFDFTGVLKLDLETGEAILEPHHSTADEVDEACAALA